MQQTGKRTVRWQKWAIAFAGLAVLFLARKLLWQSAVMLFWGMVMALAALPLMKRLEKKLSISAAAALSMAALGLTAALSIGLLIPAVLSQMRQLLGMLPSLLENVSRYLPMKEMLLDTGALSAAAPRVMGWMGGMAGSIGQWMLSPLFAFYFLRDRKRIAQRGLMLLPGDKRALIVRILREMRRETAAYLRGQLMVSAIVGGLTAVGLLFCGVPSWLALGLMMGVLEWIPYVGPLMGTALIALFALPLGLARMLWAIGVALVVQQAEGSLLSPQLISDATRLHPALIVLCIALGGGAAGVSGILLSVPLVLCLRAALRVAAQERAKES